MNYIRICEGLRDFGKLVPPSELLKHIKSFDKDYYASIFYYTEEHYKQFQEKGSVKGMNGLITNKLVWDFDHETDIEEARKDTIELCTRLLAKGIKPDEIEVAFSGNKGFSVFIRTTSDLTEKQFQNITHNLAGDLPTRDVKIKNASRVFRIPKTRHQVSGLYKTIISLEDLSDSNCELIKELAKDPNNSMGFNTNVVILPAEITALGESRDEAVKNTKSSLDKYDGTQKPDMSKKPRNVPAYKWIILQGFIKPGAGHEATMAITSHYKNLGYPKKVVYRMLKGIFDIRHDLFPDSNVEPKEELWRKVEDVFSPEWRGGTYALENNEVLKDNCKFFLGTEGDIEQATHLVEIKSVSDSFTKYAKEIEKNTIKTGIESIDRNIRLQTSSHVVIAGSSGSGKTTLCLNLMNNVSRDNLKAVFYSMDMGKYLIYQKLAQRVTGMQDDELYNIYKSNNTAEMGRVASAISEEFKNVKFDFRSGIDMEEMRTSLLEEKAKQGDDLKLVVVDFINRIRGPYSDETANLAYIAPKLSDLANESETLIVSLAQIGRAKGGPSTELTDSRVAKGSSAIEESATALLGIWRPGYRMGEMDKFMRVALLKTRMGREFDETLYFNGLTSEIRDLNHHEQDDYERLVAAKEMDKGEKHKLDF